MVEKVIRFQCEETGRIFDNEIAANECEIRAIDFEVTFDFHKDAELKGTDFVQHNEDYYNRIVDGLINLLKKWEPALYDILVSNGGKPYIRGFIGRYFGDGKNTKDFYRWWVVLIQFCPKCYKMYNQPYHASHCNCQGEWRKAA